MTNEWNGEGLPPVGCECEFYHGWTREWLMCKILAHDSTRVIAEELNFKESVLDTSKFFERGLPLKPDDFRPIKSKQEIERDADIDELFALLAPVSEQFVARTRLNLGKILDAGYRNNGEEVSRLEISKFISRSTALEYLHDELLKNFKIYPRIAK